MCSSSEARFQCKTRILIAFSAHVSCYIHDLGPANCSSSSRALPLRFAPNLRHGTEP